MIVPRDTNKLKRADRLLAGPAVLAATIGRFLLSPFLSRPDPGRVLVIRPGGMGDLILATLAMERVGLSPAAVTWLIEKRSQSWARHLGLPHFCYDDGIGALLRHGLFSYLTVINTEQLFGLSQAVAQVFRGRGGQLHAFSTVRVAGIASSTTEYHVTTEHESLAFARLFSKALNRLINARSGITRQRPPVEGPAMVCISGRQSPTRSIPIDTFAQLVRDWLGGKSCLIAASPIDAEFAAELVERLKSQATLFRGNFEQLCHAIARCERLFTVDGGPVHIASYYNIPSTVIFTSGVAAKWSPLAPHSSIVSKSELPCMPCTRFGETPPCPFGHPCHTLDYSRDRRSAAQP